MTAIDTAATTKTMFSCVNRLIVKPRSDPGFKDGVPDVVLTKLAMLSEGNDAGPRRIIITSRNIGGPITKSNSPPFRDICLVSKKENTA